MSGQKVLNLNSKIVDTIVTAVDIALVGLDRLSIDERVSTINKLREMIHERGPFAGMPVDLVRRVRADRGHAKHY